MFGISGEHLLILAGILIIFGPRKLPELGSSIGKALRNFKEGMSNRPETTGKAEVRDPQPEPVRVTQESTKNFNEKFNDTTVEEVTSSSKRTKTEQPTASV